jgi:hypothetical protein
MTARDLVRRHVTAVDGEASLAARARRNRWNELVSRFPALDSMRVLDLGGVPAQWTRRPIRPAQVVTVNLESHPPVEEPWIVAVRGDACDLPAPVRSERFDLVYSNSVLEHVGGHARRVAFAESVHAAADHHWVQTPYRYFPVEPHWLFPGFQFLPVRARVALSERWPLGHIRSADRSTALTDVAWVELIGLTEMRSYFPDSEIWREGFGGLTKSLVAVR